MASYVRHDTSFFSGRAIFFIAIVLVHIALIYLFESGLATRIIKHVDPPLETNIVQDVKQRDAPPPPPPPKMERPPVEVPPPDVVINLPSEPTTTAITNTTTQHVDTPPPAPKAADVRTRAALDVKHSPPTDDYYPPTSRRMNETGSVTIDVCLDDGGKMAGDPKVAKTSGSSRLDEAAVRWGAHARFIQGTLNGKPVAGCTAFLVTFKLTD
jgi:protein TonB